MGPAGWKVPKTLRPGTAPAWLSALEPLTTGMLAQEGVRLWSSADERAAVGLRAGGVLYPVFPGAWDRGWESGIRAVADRVGDAWCVIGPSDWVSRLEPLLPPSQITHRVLYDFMAREPQETPVPPGPGEIRWGKDAEGEALFALQEAYEKEEVLFDPGEFQPVGSRLHFYNALRHQEILSLWTEAGPVAKAGTNALTLRWAQIGGVYTRPECRGQGTQKRLMAALLERLGSQGRGACLFVKKTNLLAGNLYRSLGFAAAGDFTILYGQRRSWAELLR